MRESTTYMGIIEEGSLNEAKKLILRFGKKSLGAPDETVTASLAGISDLERLERLLERIGDVENWQELLATT